MVFPQPSSWKSCGLSKLTRSGFGVEPRGRSHTHGVGSQGTLSLYQHILYCSLTKSLQFPPVLCSKPLASLIPLPPAPGSSLDRNCLTAWLTQRTKGRLYKNPVSLHLKITHRQLPLALISEEEIFRFPAETEELDEKDEKSMMCPPGMHKWKLEQCMVCTVCGDCTGYGASCVSSGRPDRVPGG